MSLGDKQQMKECIDEELMRNNLLYNFVFCCHDLNCKNLCHRTKLSNIYETSKNILLKSTINFTINKERKFKVVPGWNDQVKHFYRIARKHFILWKDSGRPPNGTLRENMRISRSEFKHALNDCRNNENAIRNEKMLSNLIDKNYKGFGVRFIV